MVELQPSKLTMRVRFVITSYSIHYTKLYEFGRVQSGIPTFRMANLIKDEELLQEALEDAAQIVKRKDDLSVRMTMKAIKAIESYHLD